MKKKLYKILIGLTVLLLFPVVIAVFFEYIRINDNEKLISTVYKNQLETIVSSVNAYTQDVVNNWGSRLEMWYRYPEDSAGLKRLKNENQSITSILVSHESVVEEVFSKSNQVWLKDSALQMLTLRGKEIHQLKAYYQNGYRKFLSHALPDNNMLLFFVGEGRNHRGEVYFININFSLFLQNHIRARLQSIGREEFRIVIFDEKNNNPIISTEKEYISGRLFDQVGEMWLFPRVRIGINLKKQTISDLASNRIREGLILTGVVLIVLMGGVWFLFASVKREIQLAQIKSEFISNVSHEIRTPLALISMYIETLEMGRIKTLEKINEYYGIISKETRRLTGIVNKILNFSRLESGKQQFKFEVCNLNSITETVMETYQFHMVKKGFELEFHRSENMPCSKCDKESITDAIINLLDNAQKYGAHNKKIELKTGVKKKYVFVEVKDYGPGIPKRNQKFVFDKFYRVTTGDLANDVKGSGLGLAIVSEIVKAHHGKVTLNSKPGEGCAFRLYLPIMQDSKS
jgi:two-component system phosphate regulon sensor histidine kinase PhoR